MTDDNSVDPLDMAVSSAARVDRLGRHMTTRDGYLDAVGTGTAEMVAAGARLGACMALVSLAADVRRIADFLERGSIVRNIHTGR
jgi:hypothetical protein